MCPIIGALLYIYSRGSAQRMCNFHTACRDITNHVTMLLDTSGESHLAIAISLRSTDGKSVCIMQEVISLACMLYALRHS